MNNIKARQKNFNLALSCYLNNKQNEKCKSS